MKKGGKKRALDPLARDQPVPEGVKVSSSSVEVSVPNRASASDAAALLSSFAAWGPAAAAAQPSAFRRVTLENENPFEPSTLLPAALSVLRALEGAPVDSLLLVLSKPSQDFELPGSALQLPQLKDLELMLRDDWDDTSDDKGLSADPSAPGGALTGSLAHLSSLTKLLLDGCRLSPGCELPPSLQQLELRGRCSYEAGALAHLTALTHLKFGWSERVEVDALPPALQALEMSHCCRPDSASYKPGWAVLLGSAPAATLTSLKIVNLRAEPGQEDLFDNLVDLAALAKLTSLETLDLSFCDFRSGPGMTAALRTLPKLRTLRLTGTRLLHDKFKPGYLPSTESFDVIGVPQLEELLIKMMEVESLLICDCPKLKTITINFCDLLMSVMVDGVPSLDCASISFNRMLHEDYAEITAPASARLVFFGNAQGEGPWW